MMGSDGLAQDGYAGAMANPFGHAQLTAEGVWSSYARAFFAAAFLNASCESA